MKVIDDILSQKYNNHTLPFLWMHGEDETTIRQYIRAIASANIGAVCLESRPHPEYLKAGWWRDVEIVLDECRRHQMKVWFFDDQHFPTGYAGGALEKPENKGLRKTFLAETQLDFIGPQDHVAITVSWAAGNRPPIMSVGKENDVKSVDGKAQSNRIMAVLASKKNAYKEVDEESTLDLTDKVFDGVLYWQLPAGEWTISVIYQTQEGGEKATQGYLNPLMPAATDLLLENVYQQHFEHFKKDFGHTIAGFFSDEPRFGNTKGPDARIGKTDMNLPWCPGLLEKIATRSKLPITELVKSLPLLFHGDSQLAHRLQYAYMDVVSCLYRDNFSKRIGDWCQKHQVKYIGHVIEDNNAHARLGYGAGNFFRSMAGQDMAGIDVVLHQLLPQQNNGYFNAMTSTGWDGEFFHYALAELGASLGSLDPKKHGDTMCELFGAYGWAEDISFMKWLADHMLVRGVNNFVPHAFTMKPYPDPDCPPHMYAQGNNPQYRGMSVLMDYMNRVASIFSQGQHMAQVAVLYHGEAEWAGKRMLLQKVTRPLVENQIDFEIVPIDYVEQADLAVEGEFKINQSKFKTLLIPYSESLPVQFIKTCIRLIKCGVQVIFIDAMPDHLSDSTDNMQLLTELSQQAQLVPLTKLPQLMLSSQVSGLVTDRSVPWLRYYAYQHEDGQAYMFFNEHSTQSLACNVALPTKKLKIYDPMTNESQNIESCGNQYKLKLAPAESLIIYTTNELVEKQPIKKRTEILALADCQWHLSFEGVGLESNTDVKIDTDGLPMLGMGDEYRHFAGTITYQTTFETNSRQLWLNLYRLTGVVDVLVNGQVVGTKIGTPYEFDLSNASRLGQNELQIKWTSSLGRFQQDYLSQYMVEPPLGINKGVLSIENEVGTTQDER